MQPGAGAKAEGACVSLCLLHPIAPHCTPQCPAAPHSTPLHQLPGSMLPDKGDQTEKRSRDPCRAAGPASPGSLVQTVEQQMLFRGCGLFTGTIANQPQNGRRRKSVGQIRPHWCLAKASPCPGCHRKGCSRGWVLPGWGLQCLHAQLSPARSSAGMGGLFRHRRFDYFSKA